MYVTKLCTIFHHSKLNHKPTSFLTTSLISVNFHPSPFSGLKGGKAENQLLPPNGQKVRAEMASLADTKGGNARKPSASSEDNEASSRQQPEDALDFLDGEDYSRYDIDQFHAMVELAWKAFRSLVFFEIRLLRKDIT